MTFNTWWTDSPAYTPPAEAIATRTTLVHMCSAFRAVWQAWAFQLQGAP
jgi:hypothetical protein